MQKKRYKGVALCLAICLGVGTATACKDDHAHAWYQGVGIDATCEDGGRKTYKCDCGKMQVKETSALGHDVVEAVGQAATCTEKGWEAYSYCARTGCTYTTYQEISPMGHDWQETDGEKSCATCGILYDENLEEHTHVFDEVIERVEPTCRQSGSQIAQCECGETENVTLEKLGHAWSAWEDTSEGKQSFCSTCGSIRVETDEDALDSEESASVESSSDSSTSSGSSVIGTSSESSISESSVSESVGPGEETSSSAESGNNDESSEEGSEESSEESSEEHTHVFVEIETTAASCTQNGSRTESCVCGETRSESIPATGHTYIGGVCACGARETRSNLLYALNDDQTYYICVGFVGEAQQTAVIADEYQGKPVKEIAANAFKDDYDLFSVTIGRNIERIGEKAFDGCSNLVEVYNLSSMTIAAGVYNVDCGGLGESVKVVHTSVTPPSRIERNEEFVFYNDGVEKVLIGCASAAVSLNIPEGITAINKDVFNHCEGLENVVLPNTLKQIGSEFLGCTTLRSVTIGRGVTKIEGYAFKEATALDALTFLICDGWKSNGAAVDSNVLKDAALAASALKKGGGYYEYGLVRE